MAGLQKQPIVQENKKSPERHIFTKIAQKVSSAAGHPAAFILSLTIVAVWALSGPLFGFSDTWQLVINTGTTIVTFLMVFLIQNTQNRDTKAMQIKLDELIRVSKGAHNILIDLEELDEKKLEEIRYYYEKIAEFAREQVRQNRDDTDVPDVKFKL